MAPPDRRFSLRATAIQHRIRAQRSRTSGTLERSKNHVNATVTRDVVVAVTMAALGLRD
jgi:hypothetical protein